jgi:uncharacterized protein YjbI with pentapeptide repeats
MAESTEDLGKIDEISKNAQKLFLVMLSVCVYTWVAIATTTDPRLLADSTSFSLPLFGVMIPIVLFYFAAPFLLLCLYIYCHLHLQRLWEGLAALPEVSSADRTPIQRIFLWPLNSFVRMHLVHFRDDVTPPYLTRLEILIFIVFAWGIVPLTILFCWLRYLPRQEWFLTSLHTLLLVVAVGFGIMSYHLAKTVLDRTSIATRWQRMVTVTLGAFGCGALVAVLSFGAIEGVPSERYHRCNPDLEDWCWPSVPNLSSGNIRRVVPAFFAFLGYSVFANLQDQEVSSKPTGGTDEEKREIATATGARLKKRSLRYAKAFRAYLVSADLRGADLEGANLYEADLRGARFEGHKLANLQGANLHSAFLRLAQLQRANLSGAELAQADLTWASLHHARLDGANLIGAHLYAASLQGTSFLGASLQAAYLQGANCDSNGAATLRTANAMSEKIAVPDFTQANLQKADLRGACLDGAVLVGADLSEAKLQGAKLTQANLQRSNLRKADLREAWLEGAFLAGANLQEADLREAVLNKTDLRGADLKGARLEEAALCGINLGAVSGLTRKQVERSFWDEKTKFSSSLDALPKAQQPARCVIEGPGEGMAEVAQEHGKVLVSTSIQH